MTRPPEQRLLTEANANATFVAAVDESGAPIPDMRAKITFGADGVPTDITLEEG